MSLLSTSLCSLPVTWLLALPPDLPSTLFSSCLQKALVLKVCARDEPQQGFSSLQSWGWQCDQISCNIHWRKPGQELSPHCASFCWMVQLNNTNPLGFKLQSSRYISYEYRPRCQLCSVHICSHFISKRHASICSSVHMGSKCQYAASLSPSKKHKWDSANFDTRKRKALEKIIVQQRWAGAQYP